MAKDGMKRSAYCQGDPVFNEVWGKWRKEERRAREEARAMMPIRVMGIVRLLVKRAGYKLINGIYFCIGLGVGSVITMAAFVITIWVVLFWRKWK